jgi:hypothetical protein
MIAAATIAAVIITGYCVWVRRDAWNCRWELGSSITAASMFACLLLMNPALSLTLSAPLHDLTGRWNIEDLLGHLAYLAGLVTLAQTLAKRTNLDDPERFLRRRLEAPIAIALPLLIGLFIVATPGKHWPDLFRAPVTGWMTLYWLALCTSASYLLIHILRLLWVVRRDPRSTVTANIYIAAITIDLGCLSSVVASRVIAGYPAAVTWMLLCVAACGYAIAPAYSWHIKTHTTPWRAPLT